MNDSDTSAAPFRWPPRDAADDDDGAASQPPPTSTQPPPARRSRRPSRSTGVSGLLREFDAVLLGGRSPVAERVPGSALALPEASGCPRCGRTVTAEERTPGEPGCPSCRVESLAWDRFVRLGEHDGVLRDAILETKYGRWRREGDRLGQRLGARLRSALEQAGMDAGAAVVTAVPMPPVRRVLRGIDHTAVIARGVALASGCMYRPMLAKRGGRPQTSVSPSARARNIRGRVRRTRNWPAGTRVVVLVDDVRTTGATLHECCRALFEGVQRKGDAGVPAIWACVLATARDPARRPGVADRARSAFSSDDS